MQSNPRPVVGASALPVGELGVLLPKMRLQLQHVSEVLSTVRAPLRQDFPTQTPVPPTGKSGVLVFLTTAMQSSFLRGVEVEGASAAEVCGPFLCFVRVKHVALQRDA
jgi:hypothetical protein